MKGEQPADITPSVLGVCLSVCREYRRLQSESQRLLKAVSVIRVSVLLSVHNICVGGIDSSVDSWCMICSRAIHVHVLAVV